VAVEKDLIEDGQLMLILRLFTQYQPTACSFSLEKGQRSWKLEPFTSKRTLTNGRLPNSLSAPQLVSYKPLGKYRGNEWTGPIFV
jgi:hypothetical protein